ncbi:MAG: hypothetical protein AB7O62_03525 [Pirellulales bacterium]
MSETLFDELTTACASGGADAALQKLAARLSEQGQFHELFDTRLMQARRKLGLPVAQASGLDDLPEPQRSQVESAYLEACREVGGLLLDAGNVREAWMYLRPVGDRPAVAAGLAKIAPDDENVQDLIEVALHEGVHPKLGLELVLTHFGVCNAITTCEAAMQRHTPPQREEVARLLVHRLHKDLLSNLQAEVARQEGTPPAEKTIQGLVADRDWLFASDNYHIDTSHLHAVVRFARQVTDAETLRLAFDLTEYGRRLSNQYQYPGEEPFADSQTAHGLFFQAQFGEQVEQALKYFGDKAKSLPLEEHGPGPAEVYIALLARLGRTAEALEAAAQLLPAGTQTSGFAPSLNELARATGNYGRMMEICRERGDVLGFAAGLAEQSA